MSSKMPITIGVFPDKYNKMPVSNSFVLLLNIVIFSCDILPAANAMDVMNSNPNGNGTEAMNSTENAGNKCPDKQSCWAEYEGKWKTQLNGGNVYNKINGQNAIYNGTDGTCGIWDGKKYNEFNGTIYDLNSIENMQQFMEYAIMPACGNPYHEFVRDCAKKYFYMGKKAAESDIMKAEDKFKKVHLLALLEACFICAESDDPKKPPSVPSDISVEVTYRWPAGSFFSNCAEEQNAALQKIKLPIGKDGRNSFTFVMLFVPRKCHAVFSTDAPQTSYDNIKMKVDYNCNGQKSVTVNLPDLEPTQFVGNFAEMRYVEFNLGKGASGVQKLKWENMVVSRDGKFEWKKKSKNA